MALSKVQGIGGQVTPNLGRRNLIVNGAMQVAQRGTSATTFAYGTVDRFKPTEGSTSSLAVTQTQDTNAPSGFSNSYKITVTTAETMSGSKQLAVFHAMEAQDILFMQAQESGDDTSDIVTEKQRLRDITNQVDSMTTIDQLKTASIDE